MLTQNDHANKTSRTHISFHTYETYKNRRFLHVFISLQSSSIQKATKLPHVSKPKILLKCNADTSWIEQVYNNEHLSIYYVYVVGTRGASICVFGSIFDAVNWLEH